METTAPSTVTRPMTGEEYLESIRDRREIYCYGERVDAPGSGRRHDDGGRRAGCRAVEDRLHVDSIRIEHVGGVVARAVGSHGHRADRCPGRQRRGRPWPARISATAARARSGSYRSAIARVHSRAHDRPSRVRARRDVQPRPTSRAAPIVPARHEIGLVERISSPSRLRPGPCGASGCRAVVVGVGFFDFLHGQTGVAPNGRFDAQLASST